MEKNDIKKFREALKNGEVKFTYTKKDGTKRDAVGTLCEKLLPKETPTDKYDVTSIEWDVEGEWKTTLKNDPYASREVFDKLVASLPAHCKVKISTDVVEDDIEDELKLTLLDEFGFHCNSIAYTKIEKKEQKRLPEGTIFYYDIEKKGYRSFNESQLVEVIC